MKANFMKRMIRLIPALLALMIIAAMMAPAAGATEEGGRVDSEEVTPSTEESTTTTTVPPTVKIKNFYIIGSNDKYYLCSPEMTDNVDSYSFNIPDWMESATILIKAATGLKVTSDSADFNENSGVYRGKIKDITKSSQSYTVRLEGSSATRTLTVTIKRSNIPCYFDSISMYKGDTAINSKGTITDGLTFNLDSGTTGGVKLRIKPRHENEVKVANLTGLTVDQIDGSEPKTTLELNTATMRYEYSPTLVEGTNLFRVTVSAGNVTKTCDVTIIVGDANANAPTTTTEPTAAPTAPVSDSSVIGGQDSVTLTTTSATEKSGGLFNGSGKMSPVMWVLIGIIITIIAGAIIFMIINLSNNRDDYDDDYYDDYGYDRPAPRRRSRRNLAEYVDEDDYYDEPRPVYRSREEYDERYGDGYSYDDTYDGYSSRSQYRSEGGRSRGGDFYEDDYDNF